MKNSNFYTAAKTVLLFAFVLVLTNSLFAQSETKKESAVNAAPSGSTQTVNAQQAGPWNIGIDPVRNIVRVANTAADAVPVQIVHGAEKQPFHLRIVVSVFGGGPSSATETSTDLPEGKRFVIEAISAHAEIPAGGRAVISIQSYADANFGGWGAQYLSLADQGTYGASTVLTANHKTTGFAVGRITLRVRPTWTGPTGGTLVIISGYLEDLPPVP